jgi:hypothetical protein
LPSHLFPEFLEEGTSGRDNYALNNYVCIGTKITTFSQGILTDTGKLWAFAIDSKVPK